MNDIEPVSPLAVGRGYRSATSLNVRPLVAAIIVLFLAWLALTAILIGVGEGVTHSATALAWDRQVTEVIIAHRSPLLDAIMKLTTWLGTWVSLAGLATLMVVLTALRRLPVAWIVLAVAAWAGETVGVSLAKRVVLRHRPPERIWLMRAHGWSWPSGHAATAAVVFTVMAIVVFYLVRNGALRALAWIVALLAVASVGFSRIELGVHWTTDVVGGIVFVGLWIAALWIATLWIAAIALAPAPPRPGRRPKPK